MKEALKRLYEVSPRSIEELLLVKGVGPATLRALILVSDVIYHEPPSINDPVTHPYDPYVYAYAFGGKDGEPFPVNRRVMEETISILEDIVFKAKLPVEERLKVLRRLKRFIHGC